MNLVAPRLGRRPHRAVPALSLWPEVTLPLARAHEICGQARRMLALRMAAAALARADGPVFWIAPQRGADPLNPDGVAALLPPQRLIFVTPARGQDLLWALEEVLRSGAAPVAVADLPEPPGMTPVRRLHLAAEAGAEDGAYRPLGLVLTPGAGGAPGIETRWRAEPRHGPGRSCWRIERTRARMAPPAAWTLEGEGLTSAPLEPV
jgi:protein ImuA